jgi:hypothetical protein
MGGGQAIGKQLAELALRPAVDQELRDKVKVRARVDAAGDAGGDDGEDVSGTLATDVAPRDSQSAAMTAARSTPPSFPC